MLIDVHTSFLPTTYRRRPLPVLFLQAAGISYYNPQVDVWYDELVNIEAREKEAAAVLLFVIDGSTRALASIMESTE